MPAPGPAAGSMPRTVIDEFDIGLRSVVEHSRLSIGLFKFIQYATAPHGHTGDCLAWTYRRRDNRGTRDAKYSRQK